MSCVPASKNNDPVHNSTFRRRNFLKWAITGVLAIGPLAKGLHYVCNKPRVYKLVLRPPFPQISYAMNKPIWSNKKADNMPPHSPDRSPKTSNIIKQGNMGGCDFVSLVISKHENNASIMLSFKEQQGKKAKKYQIEMLVYDTLYNILANGMITNNPKAEQSFYSLGGRSVYISAIKTMCIKIPCDLLGSIDHILILTTETSSRIEKSGNV